MSRRRWLLPLAATLAAVLGLWLFRERLWAWVSLMIAVAACLPIFRRFERRSAATGEVLLLAVMVALSVAGRFAFAAIPHFKPVTAIVVITGMYLGGQAGFLCGALSAVISNMLFGQGPWTPFQMAAWGLLGLLAAVLSRPLQRHRWALALYAAFAGILYSLLMDVFTVVWWDGTFNLPRYLAALVTALPITAVYAASNILFLLALAAPIGKKLGRVRLKYGL